MHGTTQLQYLSISWKSVKKIKVSLKSDQNTGTLHEYRYTFSIVSCSFLCRLSNVSDQRCRENQNIIYVSNFFFFKNCAISGMWKNIVQSEMPKMTIWHTCISQWVPKATNAHLEYVIISAFLLQQGLQEHTSLLCYTYIACFIS